MNKNIMKMADDANYKPSVFMALILVVVFMLLGGIPASFIQMGSSKIMNLAIRDLALGFGITSLILFLYVRLIEKRFISSLGFQLEHAKKYFKGLLMGAILFSTIVFASILSGGLAFKVTLNSVSLTSIALLLLGFIIQGATEEILFRGWLMPILGARYNVVLAIIISSLSFAMIHGLNPGISIMGIINLVLFGLFAALYTLDENSLWGICGFHSIWNWVQGSVYGIKVSGTTVPGGSLFQSTAVEGKDFLSGGAFGLEASIFCTIILGLYCFYLFKKLRSQHV